MVREHCRNAPSTETIFALDPFHRQRHALPDADT